MPAQQPERTVPDALLAPDIDMAAVTLAVEDLAGQSEYYQQALGLVQLAESAESAEGVVLGRGSSPIVILTHAPGLPLPGRTEAGLFHTAVLFPDRATLAAAVYRAARHPRSRYVGSADHLVSEAFYFTDPEGNGIELYRDRPRSEWSHEDGRVVMGSLPLDPNAFLTAHLQEERVDLAAQDPASVGHVHLQVGDVGVARRFYVEVLGFEVAAEWPGAIFVAAGGYHHHMAMNTWNSRGAGPRAATLGLGEVAIDVPSREDLDAARTRLESAGVQVADDGLALRVSDPWNTPVTLKIGG